MKKMKKIWRYKFFLILPVFTMLFLGGCFSGGEPEEVRLLRKADVVEIEEGHQEYYFKLLSKDEKRAYREMQKGVKDRKKEFYVTTADGEKIDKAYYALLKDHPELFWIHNRKQVYKTTYGKNDYCLFAPGYSYSAEEMKEIQMSMEQAYKEVLTFISLGADDYEKVKAVYTYLIDLAEYEISEDDQSIAGIFWKKRAVCAGYAGAAQYLLERLEIPCIYVEGTAKESQEGHAWNIVQIDGQYYYMDITNGDQPEFLEGDAAQLVEHKTILYDYLCPFPEEYEKMYTPSSEFAIPPCTKTDKNFYVLNQACFDAYDWEQLYDLCCLRLDSGAAVIRFKFRTQEGFDQAYQEWINGDAAREIARYYMKLYDLEEVEYHYGVFENLKTIYYMF